MGTTEGTIVANAITFEDIAQTWKDLEAKYPRVLTKIVCHPTLVYRLVFLFGPIKRGYGSWAQIPIMEDEKLQADQIELKFSDGSEETVVLQSGRDTFPC